MPEMFLTNDASQYTTNRQHRTEAEKYVSHKHILISNSRRFLTVTHKDSAPSLFESMLPKNVAEANDSEVDLGGSSGRGTEDGIDTEGDIDAEKESADEESEEESDEESEASIERTEEQRCVKWYFKQRDDGSGYRNKTFELDLREPPGCGCELCDIVARLAIWFIRLVDPTAHLDDAVELEFIPISNLRFGWLNGIVDIRLYTEVSTTHTEPYQFSGLTNPSIVWASNLAACRWVYRAQVVILP